ncbi:hypothetical protein [Burkholderia sp. BCC1638]|uniref:hypothetical protein n=1 Tax=Burkholderia sp. BCC1638 TaxID=2681391 RepID=UPI00158B5EB2|nr:hypothetical protein [Burkholderia sp. BCC1638]
MRDTVHLVKHLFRCVKRQPAFAVFELLSDLRARIWIRYGVELHELIRQQRSPPTDADIDDIEGGF